MFQPAAAQRAVVAHAGHDHADGAAAVDIGDAAEEVIDGGPATVLRRIVGDPQYDLVVVTFDLHLPAAGSDPDLAGANCPAVDTLANVQRRAAIQIVGQRAGENRRHVLYDEQRHGQIGRQLRHHFRQCLGSAGGNPQGHDVRRTGRWDVGQIANLLLFRHFGNLPHGRAVEDLLDAAPAGEGCKLAAQLAAQVLDVGLHARVAGLEDEVEGPAFQRGKRGLGPLGREGAEHNRTGRRVSPPQLLEHGLAVHLRHLQVEHQHVGGLLIEPLQGDLAVGRRAHNFHVGAAGEHVGDDLAIRHRVIDNQYAEGSVHIRLQGQGFWWHASRIGESITVAFRSAKVAFFRGAKGDTY